MFCRPWPLRLGSLSSWIVILNVHNATKFNQIQQIERKMWELNAFSELRTTKAILNSFPKKFKASYN